ncbi:MAG: GWxTD domain-containing protein [Gemmatimonadota bacterium]|nr:GWxTD domain-containing protein [Gemmatimonadota bacterium]
MSYKRDTKMRRRCTRLINYPFSFLCLSLCFPTSIKAVKQNDAVSLYEAALVQVESVSVEESLDAFRDVLKVDRKHAPSHYEIARLYMSLDTPMDRQSARNALDIAIRLDPGNGDYQLTLGELLGKQGLWLNAERHYEKVCETHPERFSEAAYMVGFFAMQAFLKYIDMEHIDIVTGLGPPTYHLFRWEEHATRDREKALAFLVKSIVADPRNRDGYYDLGLIHYESKNPKGLVEASKLCMDQYPEDKDALLYCGLGYQGMGEWETAHEYYICALERMSAEERALMESVDLIASQEEQSVLDSIATTDTTRIGWTDNRERVRFWRKRDPLYLTTFSERRLEHYGRVAYANLRYGQRLKGTPGWQTDRGKAHIKFGRALNKKATRLEIPGGVDSFDGRFGQSIQGGDEEWYYEGFSISFVNSDGLDSWRFDTRPGRISARYIFNHQPTHYMDPFRHHKYRIPNQVASFKDGDRLRVELAYALPKYNVSATDADSGFVLENGIFLFDKDWEEVYRKRSELNLRWPELTPSGYPVADSLRNSHLMFQLAFRVPSGTYHLVGEVRDRKKGSIGTFREAREFATADSSLSISDLLLATDIETGSPFPERRSHLNVVANPLRTYHRSEPAFIYLEVYNLKRDEYGRTEYEISYRIGRPGEDEIDPYLFIAQRLPGNGKSSGATQVSVTRNERLEVMEVKEVREPDDDEEARRIKEMARSQEGLETTVTSRYEGDREEDFTYLQIDLGHVPVGVHRLTVRVTDTKTGQTAAREELFRVIE